MMYIKKILCILLTIVLFIVVYLYRPETFHIKSQRVVVDTVEDLKNNSEYIIKGQFVSDIETVKINDQEDYRIYDFIIDEIYKGKPLNQKTITVAQRKYLYKDYSPMGRISIKDELYIQPIINLSKDYVIFVKYDQNTDRFYPATEPFLAILDNQKLILQSNLITKNISNQKYYKGIKYIQVKYDYQKIKDFSNTFTLDDLKK